MNFSVAKLGLCLLGAIAGVAGLQFNRPQAPAVNFVKFGFNEGRYTLSPEIARVASFGFGHALSSLLWVRFLQETPPEKAPPGTRTWLFDDLNTMTSLDPDFLPAYREGALYLSVITEDTKGATILLERGARLHPEDASVLGAIAYHYHFELNQPDRAGPYYLALSKLPNVPFLYSMMAASYLKRTGDVNAGIDLLQSMLKTTKDPEARARIEEKIQKLQGKGNAS